MPTLLARILAEIGDGQGALSKGRLSSFSDLSPEELRLFNQMWPHIDRPLRRKVVTRLLRAAAEDVTLNFDAVFQACLSDPDAGVRARAIEGLEECEDCRLIDKLIALLCEDEAVSVRTRATRALGRFAMLAELGKIHARYTDKLASTLLDTFDDPSQSRAVRAQALESVAPFSLPRVAEAIQRGYHSPELHASAITAMGLNCDPAWLSVLIRELASATAELRERAAQACGELGEPEAVPHLIELVADPERQVGQSAIRALGQIGDSQAKKALKRVCQHPDAEYRKLAEAALGELALEDDILSSRIQG